LRVKRFTYGVWGEQQRNVRSHFVIDEEGKLSDVQVQVTPEESASTPATV
jgi:peroxiredoxin